MCKKFHKDGPLGMLKGLFFEIFHSLHEKKPRQFAVNFFKIHMLVYFFVLHLSQMKN